MAMADFSEVDYFQEVSSSIEAVQNMASGPDHRLQLNVFQCQYLSAKLAVTGSSLTAKSDTLMKIHDNADIRRKALLKLLYTVKRGEKLVQNCCCFTESWLESAVTLVKIKEDIVDILLDMRWWTSMVDIAIASVTWMSYGEKFELELLKGAENDFNDLMSQLLLSSNDLEEAAIKDKEQLLKRLREFQASCAGRTRDAKADHEYLLAVHLRSRLENTELETTANLDLNAYQDSKLIGQGAFGAVMNVKWLKRRCALKMLRCQCSREANSLSAFQHPHIVQFFRYWEAPFDARTHDTPSGTPHGLLRSDTSKALKSHILMELLPMDLADHIQDLITPEYSMPEDVAIDVMLQVAKAMWHLNSKDVAHRDLKPNNVLVRPVPRDEVPELSAQGYLRVKLGDFGLAKTKALSESVSKLSRNVGNRLYGAPEVFGTETFPERMFPKKADVWSFGIMFSEVLTGKPPWEVTGPDGMKLLHGRIRKQGIRPQLPENCPDCLKFCITSCWEYRPKDRPNFKDLWRMVRLAQVRSLGIIRANHDLFTYKTSDNVRRLHQSKKLPVLGPGPALGKQPSLKSNSLWLLLWRITYLLFRRGEIDIANSDSNREFAKPGSSAPRSEDQPLGYLVNQVWPVSTSDSELDVIFFEGNVGSRMYLSCKDTWVQRGKPDVWWPRDWLPVDAKGDIRVFLLEYSISEAGIEGVVDELQRLFVFRDRWNRRHTWQRPIVLVGHSLGCVVIEKLVVALDERAKSIDSLNDEIEIGRAKVSKSFLESLAGCFFYAPPYKGLVPSEELLRHVFGGLNYRIGLLADLCVSSPKLKDLSEAFMVARSEQVKLMALIEGFHTLGRMVVPPSSMLEFAGRGTVEELVDSNHSDVCKPTNKDHLAYRKLLKFINDILNNQKVIQDQASTDKGPAAMLNE